MAIGWWHPSHNKSRWFPTLQRHQAGQWGGCSSLFVFLEVKYKKNLEERVSSQSMAIQCYLFIGPQPEYPCNSPCVPLHGDWLMGSVITKADGFPRCSATKGDTGGVAHNFLYSSRWNIKHFLPTIPPRDQELDVFVMVIEPLKCPPMYPIMNLPSGYSPRGRVSIGK